MPKLPPLKSSAPPPSRPARINYSRHCEGGVLPPEAISYKVGDCFVAKNKNAPRNDVEEAIIKDLIEYIAKSLVEHPDEVQVSESGGNRVRIELSVAKDDMGRVIGKGGKVANSIRTLLRVAAERKGKQATLDVTEP